MLIELRRDAWEEAAVASDNVMAALGRDFQRQIDMIDRVLDLLQTSDFSALSQSHAVLLENLPSIAGRMLILDSSGAVVDQSSSGPSSRTSYSDQDFFIRLSRSRALVTYISEPFVDPATQNTVIAVARRLNKADGRFVGVAVGLLYVTYLVDEMETVRLGPNQAIALLRSDGAVLARFPQTERAGRETIANSGVFRHFATAEPGLFIGRGIIDGNPRAYNFMRFQNLPLILAVGMSLEDIYADWYKTTFLLGGLFLVLNAVLGFVGFRLIRELALRRESEERYRQLSNIDGLTGLSNRRRFDEALTQEWRRARRTRKPLSLLIMDLDRFKGFNDLYGHLAGDECLRRVAAVTAGTLGRGSDLVARYGGEEIVVLLPDTDRTGGRTAAERIRTAIETLRIEHQANIGYGVVTVSIGHATYDPSENPDEARSEELVATTDAALYDAKRAGRNSVVTRRLCADPDEVNLLDEKKRLASVEQARNAVNDTAIFDAIAEIAARILGTSSAMVSLLDDQEQTFIGSSGLDALGVTADRIPRAISFCRYAIQGRAVMVVGDASQDVRFSNNPVVAGAPHIRFYAGAPLIVSSDGHAIGTIAVVDEVARPEISEMHRRLLVELATVVMNHLEKDGSGSRRDAMAPAADEEKAPLYRLSLA
ncbi:diguanylate cyclase [Consotaella salsifontis]|nr:diguanylate cyclase [Consotaella salsifontis]